MMVRMGLGWMVLCVLVFGVVWGAEIDLESVSVKLSRREDRELVEVDRFEVAGWEGLKRIATEEIVLSKDSTITFQSSFFRRDLDMAFFPHQVFVRFVAENGKAEVFAAKRRASTQLVEVVMAKELKQSNFWVDSREYLMEVIIGDKLMDNAATWTVCPKVRLVDQSSAVGKQQASAPVVFDFDLRVKHELQPEFSILPHFDDHHAPTPLIVLFSFLVTVPFFLYLGALVYLGTTPSHIPSTSPSALIFQASILASIGILIKFWIGWSILTTWKALALVFIPLLPSGYLSLVQVTQLQSDKIKTK